MAGIKRIAVSALVVTALAVASASAQPTSPGSCRACALPRAAGPLATPAPSAARIAARQTRSDERDQVVFTVAFAAGQAQLTAEAPGVRIDRTNTEEGMSLRVQAGDDVLEVDVRYDGRRSISRKGKTRRFGPGDFKTEHIQAVQNLTAGSPAMLAFGAVASALEDSERPEAVSLLASYALVSALHGNAGPARLLARKARRLVSVGAQPAVSVNGGQPLYCWYTYANAVYQYALDYEACYNTYWWNPLVLGACSFTWLIQVEASWFWYISCSGGFPG